ncbi:HDOD domain-containing protein [Pseudoalteromonas sp. SS15]|uniref:HDOD domain-containing protein n=1 Tax=Pseudoalteromonas sp. SS15 TaxID=3139393 RepID=UPI003BAA0042
MPISLTNEEKAILRSVSIPPRPEALIKFSEETKKPEPNISRVSEILQDDVGICAAILQVVNSSAFRRAKEIESIDQAIMILGLKRLIPLVKAVAVKAAVGTDPTMAKFWDVQTDIAHIASIVAMKLDKPALSNHAYMLALFHGVGVAILNQHFDDFEAVMAYADENNWDDAAKLQFEKYQTNHATIGALLAQQWRLPKVMINIIYYQHDTDGLFQSEELDKVGLDLLCILKLSRHCAFLKEKPSEINGEWQNIMDDVIDHLDMEEEQLFSIIEEITDEI